MEGVYKWVRVQTQVTKLTKLTKPIDETRVSSMLLRIVRRETPCASHPSGEARKRRGTCFGCKRASVAHSPSPRYVRASVRACVA